MTMITNAVESRYRGGFMSVNSAVQQTASGLANLAAGSIVVADSHGHLIGYSRVGMVAVAFFGISFYLAARLRALAPYAAKPAVKSELIPIGAVD